MRGVPASYCTPSDEVLGLMSARPVLLGRVRNDLRQSVVDERDDVT